MTISLTPGTSLKRLCPSVFLATSVDVEVVFVAFIVELTLVATAGVEGVITVCVDAGDAVTTTISSLSTSIPFTTIAFPDCSFRNCTRVSINIPCSSWFINMSGVL